MGRVRKNRSDTIKKRTGENSYIGKFEHIFNKRYSDEEIKALADEMWGWFEQKENFWLKDFATSKMISRQRISEFAQKNNYFKYIYELCQDAQESKTIRLGLNKKFNPAIAVLMLKNNHKWTDQPQIGFGEGRELPDFEGKTDTEIDNIISTYQKKNGNGNGNH